MARTYHKNNQADQQLELLGFADRGAWDFLSKDDKDLKIGPIIGRPDWILSKKSGNHLFVIDYKNRSYKKNGASSVDKYQVAVYMRMLKKLYEESNPNLIVSGALRYADKQTIGIFIDDEEENRIDQVMQHLSQSKYTKCLAFLKKYTGVNIFAVSSLAHMFVSNSDVEHAVSICIANEEWNTMVDGVGQINPDKIPARETNFLNKLRANNKKPRSQQQKAGDDAHEFMVEAYK